MDDINKRELLLKCLEKHFSKLDGQNEKYDFQLIDDILKENEFSSETFNVDDVITAVHEDPYIRFSVRGCKVRPKPPALNSDPTVVLSKKMAAILRHGLKTSGLEIYHGCYVKLDDLLKLEMFQDFTKEDVSKVVNVNGKRRYEIITDGSFELIGALQGHTGEVENLTLKPLSISDNLKIAFHGTFYSNWDLIKKEGLKKMGRNHIHLYSEESKETLRDGAEIVIEIDLEKALKDGLNFYKSKNNVILCDGEDGVLKVDYFRKAWNIKTNESLYSIHNSPEKSDSGSETSKTIFSGIKCEFI